MRESGTGMIPSERRREQSEQPSRDGLVQSLTGGPMTAPLTVWLALEAFRNPARE